MTEGGYAADLLVFDPASVGSEPARLVNDLPGARRGSSPSPIGVVRVLVNGVETVADGRHRSDPRHRAPLGA